MLRNLARKWRAMIVAAAIALVASATAYAMRVSPMVLEMESRGSGAVGRLEVQNLNQGNLAFETRITRMSFDDSGQIVEQAADEDFLIFPPQGVLPPGGRQVIRLQWVGNPDVAASQAYYVSVNQLPVQLDPVAKDQLGAQVQIVYNMKALVVVAPPGASPNIEAASVQPIQFQPQPAQAGDPLPPTVAGVQVLLRNSGRRHAMMAGLTWRFVGKDKKGEDMRIDVAPAELNRVIGTGYVPALGERTFRLPLVDAFGPGPIRLTFVQ